MSSPQTTSVTIKHNLNELGFAVATLLKEQGVPVDANRLHSAVDGITGIDEPEGQLLVLLQILGIMDFGAATSAVEAMRVVRM